MLSASAPHPLLYGVPDEVFDSFPTAFPGSLTRPQASTEDQPTTRGSNGAMRHVSRWQAQVDTCLLAAADVAPECVAVLASAGARSKTILAPTFGGPSGWSRPLHRALLDAGPARVTCQSPSRHVVGGGASPRGCGAAGSDHLDVSRALRHALLVLKRCVVGGCTLGGGRRRVVVTTAGPWPLDRAVAPETSLRDLHVEVMGAVFNDISRDTPPCSPAVCEPSNRESCALASFAAAVNGGTRGDVLQLGRGEGGYGLRFNFDFNFRAALVGSRLVSSDCPEGMRASWRACFGDENPCPDLGCVAHGRVGGEGGDSDDDDSYISPLDDFSMLSLKWAFDRECEGNGTENEHEQPSRRRESCDDRVPMAKVVVPWSTSNSGEITVGRYPMTAFQHLDGGWRGSGSISGSMSEVERAAARRLGVQLHREACKSLGDGGRVEKRDCAAATATGGGGGEKCCGEADDSDRDGGAGVEACPASPSPKTPATETHGRVGGRSPAGSISGGCRGASRALHERGVALGFSEVKVVLHDSRVAAAKGCSPDAGVVRVNTGLEPAQLHRVLIAFATPIAVIHVGRLAKYGARYLRPTKRSGILALHAAYGGVKLTWTGESTVPSAAVASLGARAEGTALAAAARNTVAPVTLAFVEASPHSRKQSSRGSDGIWEDKKTDDAMESASGAESTTCAVPRIEFLKADPSGRSFRLVIPPKSKGGSGKELLLYLRKGRKTFGGGGGAWSRQSVYVKNTETANGSMDSGAAALVRLRDAMASPPSLASRADLPDEALAILSNSLTPGAVDALVPSTLCAHCHGQLLAGVAGCLVCPASPF